MGSAQEITMTKGSLLLVLGFLVVMNCDASLKEKINELQEEILYLKSKDAKSCAELKQRPGFEKSGFFFIDPEGNGSPTKVYCDMDMEETWISHDGEDLTPIEFCQGDACFEKKFKYEAADEQIEALKVISEYCYQDVEYGCKMAPLKNTRFGYFYGWWTGSDGMKKFYLDREDT